jgi:hypothetical protein
MNRLDKCIALKEKGYTYDKDTGKIYGIYGKEITNKNTKGYIQITINTDKKYILYAHHYAYYMTYGNVDFELLDHINQNTSDNRICNLRILTNQQNQFNTKSKGYTWYKRDNKWLAQITINQKNIHLGYFNNKEEAHQAYLNAKKNYHQI